MPYSSNLSAVIARMQEARNAGLIAAAEVVRTEVKNGLRGGYKSGAFVTGHVLNSVKITPPDAEGIRVYSDVPYALFWEVGHLNTFTRKFERKEVWHPALINTTPAQLDAFNRVFERFMGEQ